jgi:Putative transmembrane protein (Alph_Pro_TM)
MSRPIRGGLRSALSFSLLFSLLCVFPAYGSAPPAPIEITQTKSIGIDAFFSGERVVVNALVPSGDQVALRVVGPRENLVLLKKGRVGGLWMNVGEITFRDIPQVYLLWTSGALSSLGTGDSSLSPGLDYQSFLSGALGDSDHEKKALLIQELIELKEAEKLYSVFEKAVQVKPMEGGAWGLVDAVITLPSKISPGTYVLELITFKGQKAQLLYSSPIEVHLVGIPALVSDLAARRGLLYGILAVTIATVSGLIIGIVFSSKGSH